MNKTNLSYNMLQDCLKELQNLKFIEVHHSIERYSTTEKGLEFLQKFTDLQELISVSSFDGCVSSPCITENKRALKAYVS
jgi:predicted transcriptional regulator